MRHFRLAGQSANRQGTQASWQRRIANCQDMHLIGQGIYRNQCTWHTVLSDEQLSCHQNFGAGQMGLQ